MQKQFFMLIIVATLISCNKDKDGNPGKVTFFCGLGNYDLIVDGHEYGKVTSTVAAPECGDELFQTLVLDPGTHSVNTRNNDTGKVGTPKSVQVTAGSCQTLQLP